MTTMTRQDQWIADAQLVDSVLGEGRRLAEIIEDTGLPKFRVVRILNCAANMFEIPVFISFYDPYDRRFLLWKRRSL